VRAAAGPTAGLAVACAAAALVGCGGRSSTLGPGTPTPSSSLSAPPDAQGSREAPPAGPPTDDLGLPPHVPLHARSGARARDVAVIRRWIDELRAGRVEQAAREFNLPSRFQNGTPVLWLTLPGDRIEANRGFNCGGRLVTAGGAGAYVVISLRLVERPGARCGSWVGHTARAAIRVDHGAIVEFYRLPDDPRVIPTRLIPHPGPMQDERGPAA
jgi:hypothetical protein